MKDNNVSSSSLLLRFLEVSIIYLFLILAYGYGYGQSDMIEITPYIKYLINPELFQNDFWIQNIVEKYPNERYAYVHLLKLLGTPNPWMFWGLHVGFSFLLIFGFLNIAELFIKEKKLVFFVVFIGFVVLFSFNLGGNNLYSNVLIPGFVANSIAIWSLYYLIKKHDQRAVLLLIPVTFIHPLVGLQLFLIYGGIFTIKLIKKEPFHNLKLLVLCFIVYASTAGVWMFLLFQNFSKGLVTNEFFYEIIEFRLAHHFLPFAFRLRNYALLIPMFLIGWHLYFKKNLRLFWFFNITIIGLVIYTIGVEGLKSSLFLSAQWFKTTSWLKLLSSIGMVHLGNKLIKMYFPKWKTKLITLGFIFIGIIGLFLVLTFNNRKPTTKDFPWMGIYNDGQKIALMAKEKTPINAIFLTPPNFTYLKHYGERSTYVDYKAMVHHKSAITIWYSRINDVFDLQNKEISSLNRLTDAKLSTDRGSIKKYKSLGVTHLITEQEIINTNLLQQEGSYYLYDISD